MFIERQSFSSIKLRRSLFLDQCAIECTVGGAIWSAVTCHRFAAWQWAKSGDKSQHSKAGRFLFPYTEVKTDLIAHLDL